MQIQVFYDHLKPSKVGQGDLVFGVQLEWASGYARTKLQSLCTAVTICATLVVPKCFWSILTLLTLQSRSHPRQLSHPVKFGDRGSVACRDISIFYDALKPIKVG